MKTKQKQPNLVVIQGNRYSFFRGNVPVVVVETSMDRTYLEHYRKNPEKIFSEAEDE